MKIHKLFGTPWQPVFGVADSNLKDFFSVVSGRTGFMWVFTMLCCREPQCRKSPLHVFYCQWNQTGYYNSVTGVAVALKQAQSPAFTKYINQVIANAKALGESLVKYGYTLVTGGWCHYLYVFCDSLLPMSTWELKCSVGLQSLRAKTPNLVELDGAEYQILFFDSRQL